MSIFYVPGTMLSNLHIPLASASVSTWAPPCVSPPKDALQDSGPP